MTEITKSDVLEVLKRWREGARRLQREGEGASNVLDVCANAAQTVEMANDANILLEHVVPDNGERERLIADAEQAQPYDGG